MWQAAAPSGRTARGDPIGLESEARDRPIMVLVVIGGAVSVEVASKLRRSWRGTRVGGG